MKNDSNGLAKEIRQGMTLDEKIGQLFMVRPEALEGRNTENVTDSVLDKPIAEQTDRDKIATTSISDVQKANLRKYNVGGIAFFSQNIVTRDELIQYIKDLQNNSKYSMFIGVDEEGGIVQRLGRKEGMGVTKFPNMREIGQTDKGRDFKEALRVGSTLADDIKRLGFNMDFAPVADIQTNPENKVIGDRAFSSDAIEASKMVAQAVKGFQKHNVSATLKHFPGHGDTVKDSHLGMASSDVDIETWMKREALPFKAGIDAGADFVMSAHISLPKILKGQTPSTMSKEVMTNMLREALNFKKIIITDSLEMRAIINYYKSDEIILKCISAGIDILLMPTSLEQYFYKFKDLVDQGKIKEERVNESADRILQVKVDRGIIDER